MDSDVRISPVAELDRSDVVRPARSDVSLLADALLEVALASPRRDEASIDCAALGNALVQGKVEGAPHVGGRDGVPSKPNTGKVSGEGAGGSTRSTHPQRMPHFPPRGPVYLLPPAAGQSRRLFMGT